MALTADEQATLDLLTKKQGYAAHTTPPPQVVTIQRTSKSIKASLLITALMFWVGLWLSFTHDPAWVLLSALGAFGWVCTKIERWWKHD